MLVDFSRKTHDLTGPEEAINKIFPKGGESPCVPHAVRDMLNMGRKKDGEGLAEALKKISRAESEEEAKAALRSLQQR